MAPNDKRSSGRLEASEPPENRRNPPSSIPAPPTSVPRIAPWEMTDVALPPSQRPPMSMSTLPNDSVPPPPSSAPRPVAPPILASDILRDDVAPVAPAQKLIVAWLVLFSLAFGTAAIFAWLGIFAHELFVPSVVTAIVAACAALLPVPYLTRALLAAMASLVPLALGAQGYGPLAAMRTRGDWLDASTIAALTFLPGVLLFRSRYRAFRMARILLGVALVLSIPAELDFAMAALNLSTPLVTRIADGVVFAAVLGAGFGFMGAETTGLGTLWGALIVTTHAAGIGLRAFAPIVGQPGILAKHAGFYISGGFGEWVAATLAAHAIFQLLAAVSAKSARKVDVHQIVGISAEHPSEPTRMGEDERPEALGDD
ncbi:MAG TPA: hypothetical protein VF407_18215 [Polyangiaceae bacterium]